VATRANTTRSYNSLVYFSLSSPEKKVMHDEIASSRIAAVLLIVVAISVNDGTKTDD